MGFVKMIQDSPNPLDGDNYTHDSTPAVEFLSTFSLQGSYWIVCRVGDVTISLLAERGMLTIDQDEPTIQDWNIIERTFREHYQRTWQNKDFWNKE